MPAISTSSDDRNGEADSTNISGANAIVKIYFLQDAIFRGLEDRGEKGWSDPKGDEFFKQQRNKSDQATNKGRRKYFYTMQEIGREIRNSTKALEQCCPYGEDVKILDLCMAPGGYTASALEYHPTATACGISLPREKGGHKLLLPSCKCDVKLLDITMLAREFGVKDIPSDHPEHDEFLTERPFFGQQFNLMFCDGQKLRTHVRAEHREPHEALRLTVSQVILAMQRIRPGGALVLLLHKLFKPKKKHALRSSFYLIASNVQPESDAARQAVEGWKQAWWLATFGGESGTGEKKVAPEDDYVRMVLGEFGKELIEYSRQVWEVQAAALRKTDFSKLAIRQ